MSLAVPPPLPRVQRERDRLEQLARDSSEHIMATTTTATRASRARPRTSRSGSISSSSGSPDQQGLLNLHLPQHLSLAIPTTAATSSYPNYYDYSESLASPSLEAHPPRSKNMASTAMQVPIQPQQPPQQRLVDTKGPSSSHKNATTQRGLPRDRPPSYSNPNLPSSNSPVDGIILPPNKVDLDAARYRRAQQQESRRERDRDTSTSRPKPERKPSNQSTNGVARPSSAGMGPQPAHHRANSHSNARPLSPESPPLDPTGPNIQRLPTPSIPNSVLQPLNAKVLEYGTLMTEAQADMAHLDDEMRKLQDRQREAEQRFLDAKAKHDDYRRQYNDVERALRGEFARAAMNGNVNGHRGGPHPDDDVPPMPSMPNLQQYGVNGSASRQGSGNLLNNNNNHNGGGGGPGGPMPPRRTVSIQSDMVSQDSVRSHPKRGRFSRLFGV